MKQEIEIAKKIFQRPHKIRSGDFCNYKFYKQEELLVLTLSDGVGGSPCDWKVSKIICNRFLEEFDNKCDEEIQMQIVKIIDKVNKEILNEAGTCQGMKSTFCLVVWDFQRNQICYTNIGDSRIYDYSKDKLNLISKDEVKSVILTNKEGKPIVISGVIAVAEGVTNVVGSYNLTFEVNCKSDEGIQGIILTTDGFHRITTKLDEDIVEVMNSLELETGLNELYKKYKDRQEDDMTIIIARKVEESNSVPRILSSILNGEEDSSLSNKYELTRAIIYGLKQGIKNKDFRKIWKLLQVSEERRLDFGREKITELISLMIKIDFQDREIYQELLNRLRASKF